MKRTYILLALLGLILSALACNLPAGKPGTPPASTDQNQGKPFISGSGIGTIKLLTDTRGAGAKPLFKWQTVPEAARYELIVYDQAGAPYWAWDGTQTQIYLGGTESQPSADSAGPSLDAGYSWTVVAFDGNDKVIASSATRSISP